MPFGFYKFPDGICHAVNQGPAHGVKVGKPCKMFPCQDQPNHSKKHRDIDSEMDQVNDRSYRIQYYHFVTPIASV